MIQYNGHHVRVSFLTVAQYRHSKSAAVSPIAPYQAMFAIVLKYNLSSITQHGGCEPHYNLGSTV